MRAGSTFVGEIFHQNSDVFYLFEPVDGVLRHLYGTRRMWLPIDLTHLANGSAR